MLPTSLWILIILTLLLTVKAQDSSTLLSMLQSAGLSATPWRYQTVGGQSSPSLIQVQPGTNDDILRCVEVAQESSVRLRVVDEGHTPLELYPDGGNIALDMSNYRIGENTSVEDQIVIIPPTAWFESWQIRAASNVRLNDMDMFLIDHGLFLPSSPTSGNPTLAELIATAAHGSNWRDDSLSHYVTAMTIINGDGNIWEFDTWNYQDAMSALRACLGACGIITDITLQVKPLGHCTRSTFTNIQLSELFNGTNNTVLQSLTDNSFSWDISWSLMEPPLDDVIIRVFRLEEPQSSLSMKYEHGNAHLDQILSDTGGSVANLQQVTGYLPHLIDYMQDADSNNTDTGLQVEFAISDKLETFEGSIRAVEILTVEVDEWYRVRGKVPVRGVYLGWQQRGDIPCYLCPSVVSNVTDLVFTITMVTNNTHTATVSDLEDFSTQLYRKLSEGGVLVFPHLGKHHSFLTTFIDNDLTENFHDALRSLTRVRQKYKLDERDTFVNSYLTKFFKPEYKYKVASGSNAVHRGFIFVSLLSMLLSRIYMYY